MSSVTFNQINVAFDTINYPFNNILLTLIRGTATTRVVLPTKPILVRVVKPVLTVTTKVAKPVAPTYTRIQ